MITSYRLNANELSMDVLNAIRVLFKDKEIEINVSEAKDETDYLLATPANKEHLLDSIKELEEGKGIEMTIEELQRKFIA
jgi:predicted RNA binding protein with dsRBD fold (UPF0201 family)